MDWIDETINGVRYGLEGRVLYCEKSAYQKITIIESKKYGRGLLLDDCWMTLEMQEKFYNECLIHPALCSAKNIDKILIIGGGDGGSAKECLLYKGVKQVDMVEIDQRVIELSKKYLPSLGGKAWEDPRLRTLITDGVSWVESIKERTYDVIIIDGSDPSGPAKGLFNKSFFQCCKRILNTNGLFVTQSESPESFREIHIDMILTLRDVFKYADPIYSSVPMYPSGWWSWTFASAKSPDYKYPIKSRVKEIEKEKDFYIWSPRWQEGAFNTIPASIERELLNG